MNQTKMVKEGLPEFFRDVEVVGPAPIEVAKYRALHARTLSNYLAENPTSNIEVNSDSSPILLASKKVRDIYQSNDFSKIKQIELAAQNDLQAVYTNVSKNGASAWTKVRKNGKEFYMSWSSTGSMWAYTDSIKPLIKNSSTNETTYQAIVQIGSYTATGQIVGIQSYNLNFTTIIAESAIAYIVARAVSSIIADGLGFLVARFTMFLAQAAAEIGLESFSFFVSTSAIATVASCLVFAIVFIGLIYLWNWLNRKYTIRLQVLNWDEANDWSANGQYMSNAKIAGGDASLKFTLPKLLSPGDIVLPPGFDPVEVLDSVCSYAVVIWENDNTFMEGCSMAIQMVKANGNEGFMWAFDCPRWSDNKQAAQNGIESPEAYRNNATWSSTPLGFNINSTSNNIPVNFSLDALRGADDGLYNVIININKK